MPLSFSCLLVSIQTSKLHIQSQSESHYSVHSVNVTVQPLRLKFATHQHIVEPIFKPSSRQYEHTWPIKINLSRSRKMLSRLRPPKEKQVKQANEITYPANSYCSQTNSLRQYTTVCCLIIVVWPKHFVAITSEEEKKNCCADGPIIALLRMRSSWNTTNHAELLTLVLKEDVFSKLIFLWYGMLNTENIWQ
jgi:hypothetical protein